jgi:hypothetical protein
VAGFVLLHVAVDILLSVATRAISPQPVAVMNGTHMPEAKNFWWSAMPGKSADSNFDSKLASGSAVAGSNLPDARWSFWILAARIAWRRSSCSFMSRSTSSFVLLSRDVNEQPGAVIDGAHMPEAKNF